MKCVIFPVLLLRMGEATVGSVPCSRAAQYATNGGRAGIEPETLRLRGRPHTAVTGVYWLNNIHLKA